jgi:thymidine phosphorylase
MKTLVEARQLAESLVTTGDRLRVRTTALLTDMHQPLGRMAGNAVEVDETFAALQGRGPADLIEVTLTLGAEVLVSAGIDSTCDAASARLTRALESGAGLERLRKMVVAQGGDLNAHRPIAPAMEVAAARRGYIERIDTEVLGRAIITMGGGRAKLGDVLDHSVGLEMCARLGDKVEAGQPMVRLFAPSEKQAHASALVTQAITIGDAPLEAPPLIVDRIDSLSAVGAEVRR